jgi:hypothetical protein
MTRASEILRSAFHRAGKRTPARPWVALLVLFLVDGAAGQARLTDAPGTAHLYRLESELIAGNKSALFALGNYFDSATHVIDYLGYHRIDTTEAEIAKRMAQENCLFTASEIVISDKTSKKEFTTFLKRNEPRIVFSKDAAAFLITPLDARPVDFEIIELSADRKAELARKLPELLELAWVKKAGIGAMVARKDPGALFEIAAHLFRNRVRWNRYYLAEEDNLGLLQHLTGTQVVVRNEKGEFTQHIESDFYPDSRLNLLIFFAGHYKAYAFNDNRNAFVNPAAPARPPSVERALFERLASRNARVAFDAFIALTEMDPASIGIIAGEFERARVNANRSLPTFPYRFLKQITLLTDHCRQRGVDYKGLDRIQPIIESLREDLSLAERYKRENDIIERLTLADITAFEYWALIYSSEWDLTHSAGRILDKFYSRHWNEVTADDRQLDLYLKKSKLFNSIGIIGIVNKYLDKFIDSPPTVIARLRRLNTPDADVREQITSILQQSPLRIETRSEKSPDPPRNLESTLKAFAAKKALSDKEKGELFTTLSRISYEQIGLTMQHLENIAFEQPSRVDPRFIFLSRDWALDLVGNFDDPDTRKDFLSNYSKLTQSELYATYLSKHGFAFRTPDGSLDFDRIYDMLKYDVVQAFAGGGVRREDHVYPLIKLLENHFGTSLGFMNKLCMSENTYGCSSLDRARAWMTFLKENNHLQRLDTEPLSFTFR